MAPDPTAYESPIFNAGPRSCLGQQMVKLELVVVLKELLDTCSFEMDWDGSERFMGRAITAPMDGGLPVKERTRKAFAKVEEKKG
jgi:cytochrome P450